MRERLLLMLVSPFTMRPVFQLGFQHHVGVGGRIDAAEAGQNFRRYFDGLYEVARQVRQGGQEKVAEAVALEPAASEKRYWNSLESSASSSDSATMQLRISPGGRTSNSRRSRPELPPSSVTVTMAVISTSRGSRA